MVTVTKNKAARAMIELRSVGNGDVFEHPDTHEIYMRAVRGRYSNEQVPMEDGEILCVNTADGQLKTFPFRMGVHPLRGDLNIEEV